MRRVVGAAHAVTVADVRRYSGGTLYRVPSLGKGLCCALRAIVFDFFETLTDPARESGRRAAYDATARVIGIAGERFWQAVSDSFTERATGVLGGTTETLTEIARRCGFEPSAQTIADATRTHYEGARYVQADVPHIRRVISRQLPDQSSASRNAFRNRASRSVRSSRDRRALSNQGW